MRSRSWRFILLSMLLVLAVGRPAAAAVTTADPVPVGVDYQYFEAGSTNNVVVRIPIAADAGGDTLQSLAVINSFNYPPAAEPDDIAAGTVRLWYVGNDTGSFNPVAATLLGTMTFTGSRGNPQWSRTGMSNWVGNGSALYVTIDISSSPTPDATCSFQVDTSALLFAAGGYFPSAQEPVTPPMILITPYFAATQLYVNHGNTTQIIVSTGQPFSPEVLRLINPGTPFTGPVLVTGLTLTVRDGNGTALAPNTALDSLGLRDADTGMLLSQLGPLPAAPGPCYLPLNVSVTALDARRLEVFGVVCSDTLTAVSTFRLDWNSAADVAAQDGFSGGPIAVSAYNDAFPMSTNLFYVQYAAKRLSVAHVPVTAPNEVVIKSQTNVNPLNFVFRNPGNTGTARVDITRLTLAVTDATGVTLAPATVFSRVAVASQSGDVIYGEITDLSQPGNLITITFTNSFCSVPAYQSVTACVLADIRPDASATSFRLSLPNAVAVKSQDSNSLLPVSAYNAFDSDLFPMVSNAVRIASSFQVQGSSLAPQTLYPGQQSVLLELIFSHPGPSDLGPLMLHGLTLTARDRSGNPLDLSRDVAELVVVDGGGAALVRQAPAPGTAGTYLDLSGLAVAPFSAATLRLEARIAGAPADASLAVGLQSRDAVIVTQPSDLSRPVFVVGSWPLFSIPASLGGGGGALRLSNYPNPFAAGRTVTQIAYYLERPATVTVSLYTLAGDQVRSVCRGALQAAGEHVLTWNGRTEAGPVVVNGVYLLRIEAAQIGGGTVTQVRKIAVVK
jgi:hypothetical protein